MVAPPTRKHHPEPPPPPPEELFLIEVADLYLDHIQLHRKPRTYTLKRDSLTRFVRHHRSAYAADITPGDVEAFKQALARGEEETCTKPLANRTVNIHLNNVKAMFAWALKMGYVDSSPAALIEKLPEGKGKTRFLSDDEIEDLLAACASDILRDMLIIYLNTDLRLSELTELTWDDVDLVREQITVTSTKTEHTSSQGGIRHLPLTTDAVKVFERQPTREGHVFLNDIGNPFNHDSLRRRFNRARAKAGLHDVTIHTLRHTFASKLAMKGAGLKGIGDLLVHTSTGTTERYSHLTPEHLRDLVKQLEEDHEKPDPDPDVVKESVDPYTAKLIRSTRFTVRCG